MCDPLLKERIKGPFSLSRLKIIKRGITRIIPVFDWPFITSNRRARNFRLFMNIRFWSPKKRRTKKLKFSHHKNFNFKNPKMKKKFSKIFSGRKFLKMAI